MQVKQREKLESRIFLGLYHYHYSCYSLDLGECKIVSHGTTTMSVLGLRYLLEKKFNSANQWWLSQYVCPCKSVMHHNMCALVLVQVKQKWDVLPWTFKILCLHQKISSSTQRTTFIFQSNQTFLFQTDFFFINLPESQLPWKPISHSSWHCTCIL